MEKNKEEFKFTIYFIGGKNVYDLNNHFCDTYIKFFDSEYLYYASFYAKVYVFQQLSINKYFWNTDIIIVETIEKINLYNIISLITNNGEEKFHIADNFTSCGKFQDILGEVENIENLL